jgi:hypothetical protein
MAGSEGNEERLLINHIASHRADPLVVLGTIEWSHPFEAAGTSSVHIGHVLELFRHKGRAIRHHDPTGGQLAKERESVRADERNVGKIEHQPIPVVRVASEDLVARAAQLLNPWPTYLAFEP